MFTKNGKSYWNYLLNFQKFTFHYYLKFLDTLFSASFEEKKQGKSKNNFKKLQHIFFNFSVHVIYLINALDSKHSFFPYDMHFKILFFIIENVNNFNRLLCARNKLKFIFLCNIKNYYACTEEFSHLRFKFLSKIHGHRVL